MGSARPEGYATGALSALPWRTRHGDGVCRVTVPFAGIRCAAARRRRFTWQSGALVKGSNLCHGTGGNGYAFLKLYRRTGENVWLERARAFAMTAISQCRGARLAHGRGRYSLWTGDVGLAIYLWDCLRGKGRFPTIDVCDRPHRESRGRRTIWRGRYRR